MWNYSYEVIKICSNRSRVILANQGMLNFKNSIYRVKFRFFSRRICSKALFQRHQLLQYFFHSRTNHFKARSKKLIFKPVTARKESKLSHSSLIESLQNCQSVEEQIELFHSMVSLSADDVKLRQTVCQDIEKALQSFFSSTVVVHLIGSSINGFGFKGCDVDLSLQFLTGNVNKDLSGEMAFPADEKEELKVSKIYKAKNQLLTVRKILQETNFKEPLTVIPGRCPILNFSHQNLACDLSINNKLALDSTNLMSLCGKLDGRVRPLMQVIIYWAKHNRLVGGPGKFKTYAIFLMVLYFLQTRNPPVLPPIQTIFHNNESLENVDNFSYDVSQYMNQFERSTNSQTVEELLREFFIFYGNYDFSHIICPLHGCSFKRKQFFEKYDCDVNFILNTVCIQDPLSLSWNITTGVSWKHCKNFLKSVIAVWEKCHDQSFWMPQSDKWGLSAFMDSVYDPNSLMNTKDFTIHLSLPQNFGFKEAIENVQHIFKYCLDFECYEFDSVDLPQSVRNEIKTHLSKFKDVAQFLGRYVFKTNDTWLGRNTYISLSCSDNIFDHEHKVSELMKLERQNKESETFFFLCDFYSISAKDKCHLQIYFKHLNNDRFIPKLVIFLKDYIPRLMENFAVK